MVAGMHSNPPMVRAKSISFQMDVHWNTSTVTVAMVVLGKTILR